MTEEEIPPGGTTVVDPRWDPWRPEEAARQLAGVETIRLPYEQIIRRTGDGIPYLLPEIVLLFKAKHSAEAKNRADFAATLPLLDGAAADWLRWALARVHPGHAWISAMVGQPMSVLPEASQ